MSESRPEYWYEYQIKETGKMGLSDQYFNNAGEAFAYANDIQFTEILVRQNYSVHITLYYMQSKKQMYMLHPRKIRGAA